MELKEYTELYKRAFVFRRQSLDLAKFIRNAEEKGLLDKSTVATLKYRTSEAGDSELDIINVFIFELAKCLTFDDFLNTLETIGYESLAFNLRGKGVMRQKSQICVVKKENADSSMLIRFCCDMKRKVDNKFHDNLPYYFKDLTKRVHSLVLENGNDRQRHSLANQLGVLIWLQTQLHRNVEVRKHILSDFRNKFSTSIISDTSFIDTVFNCKMACTAVLNGDFDLAFAFITQAEIHASDCKWQFARTLVYHDRQFIFRKRNVEQKDPSNVKEIISSCERGLASLEDCEVENQVLLKRIFLLNKVQALLGIGTYLEIEVGESVSNENISRASELLTIVEGLSDPEAMEKRRRMLYLLSKSRLEELNRCENVAMDYLSEAKLLSKSGGILSNLESKNIELYSKRLED